MQVCGNVLKDEISAALIRTKAAWNEYCTSARVLGSLTQKQPKLPHFRDCMQNALRKILNKHCRGLTVAHQGHTTASFDLSDLEDHFTDYNSVFEHAGVKPRSYNSYDSGGTRQDAEEMVTAFLEAYDFNGLAAVMNILASNLQGTGVQDAAKNIDKALQLHSVSNPYFTATVKTTKSHVVLKVDHHYYGNSSYDQVRKWNALVADLKTFEAETGARQTTIGFRDLAAAFDALKWDENIASRTTFGAGHNIAIQYFKNHMQVMIEPETYNALIAFLTLNNIDDLCDEVLGACTSYTPTGTEAA